MKNWLLVGVAALGVGLLVGCSGPGKLETVKVKGKIVRGGQPLAGKTFKPQNVPVEEGYDGYRVGFTRVSDQRSFGEAQVDEQGAFEVELPPNAKYKVTISRFVYPQENPQSMQTAMDPTGGDAALQKYVDPTTTPLEITVGGEDTDVGTLEIK